MLFVRSPRARETAPSDAADRPSFEPGGRRFFLFGECGRAKGSASPTPASQKDGQGGKVNVDTVRT
jgi:hypothetical protein